MNEIHAKPIIDGKLWMVEQNGVKIATLHKKENNKFMLSNKEGEIYFSKKEELVRQFGKNFFLPKGSFKYEEMGRNETEEESDGISNKIKNFLSDNQIKFNELQPNKNFHDLADEIISNL